MYLFAAGFAALSLATLSHCRSLSSSKHLTRDVGTEYPFDADGGLDLIWNVTGVNGPFEVYDEDDVDNLLIAVDAQVNSQYGNNPISIAAQITTEAGGTLSFQFDINLMTDFEQYSYAAWVDIFGEMDEDLTSMGENFPTDAALDLIGDDNLGVSDGILTILYVPPQ